MAKFTTNDNESDMLYALFFRLILSLQLPLKTFFLFLGIFLFFPFSVRAEKKDFKQGHELAHRNRCDLAIPLLAKALKKTELSQKERAETLLLLSYCQYLNAEMKTSSEYFRQSLQLDPEIVYPKVLQEDQKAVEVFNKQRKVYQPTLRRHFPNPPNKTPPANSLVPLRATYITLLALGVLSLGGGILFGGITQSKLSEIEQSKIKREDAKSISEQAQSASLMSSVANGLFIGGGAILLTGGVLLFVAELGKPSLPPEKQVKTSSKTLLFSQ